MPKRKGCLAPHAHGSRKSEHKGENSEALTRHEEIIILRHCLEFRSLITVNSRRLFYQAVSQAFTESQCLPYLYSTGSLECFVGFNITRRKESYKNRTASCGESNQLDELLDQLISHIDQVERDGAPDSDPRDNESHSRPRQSSASVDFPSSLLSPPKEQSHAENHGNNQRSDADTAHALESLLTAIINKDAKTDSKIGKIERKISALELSLLDINTKLDSMLERLEHHWSESQ